MSWVEENESCAEMSSGDLAELLSCLEDDTVGSPAMTRTEIIVEEWDNRAAEPEFAMANVMEFHDTEQMTNGETIVNPGNKAFEDTWQNKFLRNFNKVRYLTILSYI